MLDGLNLFQTYSPEIDDNCQHDDVGCNHPPRQQKVALHGYLQYAFLGTYGTLGVDGFYVQGIAACFQIVECHAVRQGVTIAPILIAALHPVHKLQTFTLVVVSGCKLDGECVLTMTQVYATCFVQGLIQYHLAVILVTSQHLFLTYEQLGEHYSWQLFLLSSFSVQYPVHTVESAQQYLAILLGKYRTRVELVTLQSVSCGVVVKSVVIHAFLVVALNNNTAYTTACSYPDAVVLIFGNTTDVVVTQALLLCQVVELVGLQIQYVQTLARSYPYQSS